MNLVIDAGNSFLKYAFFENEKLINNGKISYDQLINELKVLPSFPIKNVFCCSVKNENTNEIIKKEFNHLPFTFIDKNKKFPFSINYLTPESIGLDRLIACAGAYSIQKSANFLVIDAGTCITYDFVNEDNQYMGGAISPGVNMRFKAMNLFTDRLPLAESVLNPELIGNSTTTCLQSGVINGILHEMKGFIKEIKGKNQKINIYLTGGDAVFFENALKNSIFAEPFLNLKGINEISHINA